MFTTIIKYDLDYSLTTTWKSLFKQERDPRISLRDSGTYLGLNRLTGLIDLIMTLNGHIYLDNDSVMVEIGSFIGESTEVFAKKFQKVYAIDPWVGTWFTGDDMSHIEQLFDDRVKDITNIIKIKTISNIGVNSFEDKSLDFVYIDSIHEYDYVMNDVNLWKSKIKDTGYIGGHDYNTQEFPGVVTAVNELFKENTGYLFSDTSWLFSINDLKI